MRTIPSHSTSSARRTLRLCVSKQNYSADVGFGGGLYPPGVNASDNILYEVDFCVVLKV